MTLNYELYVTSEANEAVELLASLARYAIPAGIDIGTGKTASFYVVLVADANYSTAHAVREEILDRWRNAVVDAQIEARLEQSADPMLTPGQYISLRRFAAANGRYWKSELRTLWENGAYNNGVLGGADPADLQTVRNTLGPSWLTRFRLAR